MLRKILAVAALFGALVATPVLAQTNTTTEPVVAVSSIVAPSGVAVGEEFSVTLTVSSTVPFATTEFNLSSTPGLEFVSVVAGEGIPVSNGGRYAWLAPVTGKVSVMELVFRFRASGSGTEQISISDLTLDGSVVVEDVATYVEVKTLVQRTGVVTYGPREVIVNPVAGVVVTSTTSSVSATTNFAGVYSMLLPFDNSFSTALRYSKSGDDRGAITARDALIVLYCSLGLPITMPAEYGECSIYVADVTGDKAVLAIDAWHVLRFAAGYRDGMSNVGKWFFSANLAFGKPITGPSNQENSFGWMLGDTDYSWGEDPTVFAAEASCSAGSITLRQESAGAYSFTSALAQSVMIDLDGIAIQSVVADGWMTADHGDKIAMIPLSAEPAELNALFTIQPNQGVVELEARVTICDNPEGFIKPMQTIFLPYTIR